MADIAHHGVKNYQAQASLHQLLATVAVWRRRIREREQLARFSERDLHDIGMSRATLYSELRKPFWQA